MLWESGDDQAPLFCCKALNMEDAEHPSGKAVVLACFSSGKISEKSLTVSFASCVSTSFCDIIIIIAYTSVVLFVVVTTLYHFSRIYDIFTFNCALFSRSGLKFV